MAHQVLDSDFFWVFFFDRIVFRSYPAFFSGAAWLIKFCEAVVNLSSLVDFLRFYLNVCGVTFWTAAQLTWCYVI